MSDPAGVNAWLLMAVGDDRQHGGNAGYDDQADVYYTWDSTVPNHSRIRKGDRVAVWDKDRLLGISVVEEVQENSREKLIFRCPYCEKASFKARKTLTPRYRCFKCNGVFDHPKTETTRVTEYRSRHDAAWTPLENLIAGQKLRELCEAPRSQLSMRPLRWEAFQEAILERGAERAIERVLRRVPDIVFPQGHLIEFVRVRRGQRKFREHLLNTQGEGCAFTGKAPARVLEAGHLYSYAELGVHHKHGGLLLRRDIHRLFDDGSLAVDPSSLRVDVTENLERYPQYAYLHGRQLAFVPKPAQVDWLSRHWSEHRAS